MTPGSSALPSHAGRVLILLAVSAAIVATPAAAERVRIDVPAGRAADAAIAVAQQTGTSIVIADPDVAERRIRAISGQMEPHEAVRRLARSARARAVPVGNHAWRLLAAAETRPRPAKAKPQTAPCGRPTAPEHAPHTVGTPIIVGATKRDLPLDQVADSFRCLTPCARVRRGGRNQKDHPGPCNGLFDPSRSGRNSWFIRGSPIPSFTGTDAATSRPILGEPAHSAKRARSRLRLSDSSGRVAEGSRDALRCRVPCGIIRLVPRAPDIGIASVSGNRRCADAAPVRPVPMPAQRSISLCSAQGSGPPDGRCRDARGYIDKPLLGWTTSRRTSSAAGQRAHRGGARLAARPDRRVAIYRQRRQPVRRPAAVLRSVRNALVAEGAEAIMPRRNSSSPARSARANSLLDGLTWQDLFERYDANPARRPAALFTQCERHRDAGQRNASLKPLRMASDGSFGQVFTRNRMLSDPDLVDERREARLAQTVCSQRNRRADLLRRGESLNRERLTATGGGATLARAVGGQGEDVSPMFSRIARQRDGTAEKAFPPSASLLAEVMGRNCTVCALTRKLSPGRLSVEAR